MMINEQPRPAILLLVSTPLAADPVAVDRALDELTAALRDVPAPATFVVRVAEPDDLGSYLSRRDRPRFLALHYLGHGFKPEGIPLGALVFEDRIGDVYPLDPMRLRLVLNPTNDPEPEFRLAVVMACHSESVVPAFHALGIPHIVAVEAGETVTQRAAITFFRHFYGALLTGSTVQAAFHAGRNGVALDEDLNRMGAGVALAEADKFKLLPEEGEHDRALWPAPGGGQVVVEHLPRLTAPPFHRRPAHFVGREREMREVLGRLRERRAVLIQGVSGVGKTELAKETAHWLVARRRVAPDRVVFVDLSTARDADDARRAIATGVGLSPEVVPDDAALAAGLPPGLLLILDEAEHGITHGGRFFRDLLEALVTSPARPRVLVTSQADVGSAHLPRYER